MQLQALGALCVFAFGAAFGGTASLSLSGCLGVRRFMQPMELVARRKL